MIIENYESLQCHPYCLAIPEMNESEFARLKEDISGSGQLDPIIVFEGMILDGRHRFRACIELGIEPWFKAFDGPDSAKDYVFSKNLKRRNLKRRNLKRRNLTTGQKAMAWEKLCLLQRGSNQHKVMTVDPFKMTEEQQARRQLTHTFGWSSGDIVERQKSKKWVVQDLVAADSVAWLYGPPGSYKTFVALDIAMHVATGKPWQGREVSKGSVLYVAAEGGDDIHIRRAGWESHHNDIGMIRILDDRPQLDEVGLSDGRKVRPGFNLVRNRIVEMQATVEEKLKKLLSKERELQRKIQSGDSADIAEDQQRLDELSTQTYILDEMAEDIREGNEPEPDVGIKLVVIDTYSQTASDDTKDAVNRYVRALYDLLGEFLKDAAILVIDHTTKGGDTWMGSQAKLGNVDMMAEVVAKGDIATLSMKGGRGKIKGAPAFDDIHLQMVGQEMPAVDAYGRPLSTLICTDGTKARRLAELADGDSAGATLLAMLSEDGAMVREELRSRYAAHKSCEGKKSDTIGRSFRRAVNSLLDDGLLIEQDGLLSQTT